MSAPARRVELSPQPPEVSTPGGASATVDGERIVVRNAGGAIVVVFDAERGTAEISAPAGDLTLSAPSGRISLRAGEVVCEAGRFELRAERIVERAGDVYREIGGVLQTRAGRVRTLVSDVYHVLAKRARIAAEEDAAVDGKRVLLG